MKIKEVYEDDGTRVGKNSPIFGIIFDQGHPASFTDLGFTRFLGTIKSVDKRNGMLEALAEICEYHANLFRELQKGDNLEKFNEKRDDNGVGESEEQH